MWNDEEEQWYFSVVDVVEALTDSVDTKQYIKKLRMRDEMVAMDGKQRKIQAANIKGLFRIVQSIPPPKAEPFKLWLVLLESRLRRSLEEV